jgi:hypothetical protein
MSVISKTMSMLKARPATKLFAAGFLAVMLVGCLKFPLGDPAASKLDSRLEGSWLYQTDDERAIARIYPFDAHTYCVEWIDFGKEGDSYKIRSRELYKAWLTDVKKHTFITLEPLASRLSNASEDSKMFTIFRLDFGDKTINAVPIKDDFEALKDAKSGADVTATITKEVENPALYGDAAAEFRKLDPEKDAELLKQMTQMP